MSGFIDRILSGKYPQMESIWRKEFEKMVDEVFGKIDLKPEDGGLEDEFEEVDPELDRLEELLVEERMRHEATKRELHVTKSELKAARYKLGAVQAAIDRAGQGFHDEPVG